MSNPRPLLPPLSLASPNVELPQMTLSRPRNLDRLQKGVRDSWKSFDVASINGNAVRLRVMENTAANWHVHEHSDELFYVVSGSVFIDTEEGTREMSPGDLFVVPSGTRHRARADGRATLLVVDRIG
jgi:mannose-6-phosphate isomerase-like protein (cupin superfamily)